MKASIGQHYDRTSDFQKSQFDKLLDVISGCVTLKDVRYILDLGSGSGANTYQLLSYFPYLKQVFAIEPDLEMISVANEHYTSPRITYEKMGVEDIVKLEDIAPKFDFYFCNWAAHWFAHKPKMLMDFQHLGTKNPYFAFSTCERLPSILCDVDEYIRAELLLPKSTQSPFYYHTMDQWQGLLEEYGWKILKVEKHRAVHCVQSARQYLDHWFAASTAKFLYGRQMEQISDLAISDILWFMENKYPDPACPGGLKFEEDTLFIVAQRE